MAVAKVIEVTSTSDDSFEDAINQGISKATESVENIQGAWIKEQKVDIKGGKVVNYRVDMMVTFVLL